MLSGGMAEVAVLAPDRVFKLPDNVSFEAGAGLLFNDLTVYFALAVRGYEMLIGLGAIALWLMVRIEILGPTRRRAVAPNAPTRAGKICQRRRTV